MPDLVPSPEVPTTAPRREPAPSPVDPPVGEVILVGAGPGDPDLVTVAGFRALRSADTVVHDRLVSPALVAEARPGARLIDVGKRPGGRSTSQERIHGLLVAEARRGRTVVRLKGGDPFVFGRGAEEILALREADVPVRWIPGISSSLAAPALAGIPVTHRRLARSFAVVTGHTAGRGGLPWDALARLDTLVVLMGVAHLAGIARALRDHGKRGETPVAVLERASLPGERVLRTDLARLPGDAAAWDVQAPAVLVVGRVVELLAVEAVTTTPVSWSESWSRPPISRERSA